MRVSRRELLRRWKWAGGFALAAGGGLGGLYVSSTHARNNEAQKLMAAAVPILARKTASELDSLPITAREEMRDYFHGICLDVHEFVSTICSHSFAEKLSACASDDEKHELLNLTFSQRVVPDVEILNRVHTLAGEVGKTLDRNWSECCSQVATSWNATLNYNGASKRTLDLKSQLEPMIRHSLDQARQSTYPIGQRPAASETASQIGKTALLLLPIVMVAPELGIPAFVVVPLKHLWSWVIGRLRHRADGYQTEITERLAELGNRVGDEIQQEFRKRIADLHYWQEKSLEDLAQQQAKQLQPSNF